MGPLNLYILFYTREKDMSGFHIVGFMINVFFIGICIICWCYGPIGLHRMLFYSIAIHLNLLSTFFFHFNYLFDKPIIGANWSAFIK